jgi:hypothetical protein
MRCSEDGCDGERVHRTAMCEPHYRAALARVRDDLRKGRMRRPAPVRVSRQRIPREVRALRLARAVHARGHLSKDEVADAAGVKASALSRPLAYAREAGWIEARPGVHGGGYVPGSVTPPDAI